MIEDRRVLAMIPARGGSKGIPDKNITDLKGRPLIAYTIAAATASDSIDRVIVSTDSERIAEAARTAGAEVPFLRPAELAGDTAKSIDAVLHCISFVQQQGEAYDVFVLLQPTSPLRTAEDIDAALKTFVAHGERGLASVNEIGDHPVLTRTLGEDGILHPLLDTTSTVRRQDMPVYFHVNGAIYINRVEELNRETSLNDNPVGFVMSREHSIDIDTVEDLKIAEAYLC